MFLLFSNYKFIEMAPTKTNPYQLYALKNEIFIFILADYILLQTKYVPCVSEDASGSHSLVSTFAIAGRINAAMIIIEIFLKN